MGQLAFPPNIQPIATILQNFKQFAKGEEESVCLR
jgi:hypothetical protein